MKAIDEKIRIPIIAIAGKAGSGKDTAGMLISEDYKVKRIAFADPMKHFIMKCCGVPAKVLWGPSEAKDKRLRRLLQCLGTETMREYDPDVWANTLIGRIKSWENYGYDPDCNPLLPSPHPCNTEAVIVTDLRFLSELVGLRKYTNAYTIKVCRDTGNPHMSQTQHEHRSESELDSIPEKLFDNVVNNTDTIEAFKAKIVPAVSDFLKTTSRWS